MNPLEDDDEHWPDEPEEFDPDSLGPDPPSVDTSTDFSSLDDVDDGVFENFVGAAVMLNLALFALSLGAMLVYFRNDWEFGGASLLIGIVAAIGVARFYWQFKSRDGGETEGDR